MCSSKESLILWCLITGFLWWIQRSQACHLQALERIVANWAAWWLSWAIMDCCGLWTWGQVHPQRCLGLGCSWTHQLVARLMFVLRGGEGRIRSHSCSVSHHRDLLIGVFGKIFCSDRQVMMGCWWKRFCRGVPLKLGTSNVPEKCEKSALEIAKSCMFEPRRIEETTT